MSSKNDPKKSNGKNGTGSHTAHSPNGANGKADVDARRAFLDRAMGGAPRASGNAKLPEIPAPSLDALKVKLSDVKPATQEVLLSRLEELIYTAALRLPRVRGEFIGPDDELLVDTVGYCDGKLVPFSVREAQLLGPMHDEAMPGLRERLVGERVGTTVQVLLPIPMRHPTAELRGKLAVFSVRIVSAAELQFLAPDSPEFLELANAGESVEAVLETLANEWYEEQHVEQFKQGLSHLLNELATRAQVKVDKAIVDREIDRKWRTSEGALMARLNLPHEQQDAALNSWLENHELRQELERQIAAAVVLRAIAMKEKLATPMEVSKYFDTVMPALGLAPNAVRAALTNDAEPEVVEEMATNLIYMRAAEYVWARAKVERV